VTAIIVRSRELSLDAFSRATGLHPDLVLRLVALGALEASGVAPGALTFTPVQIRRAARIARLRDGFALNYAALGLVLDLLDRIDDLERRLATRTEVQRGR
jgi:hypothetical protein